jgi:hypothetical protein
MTADSQNSQQNYLLGTAAEFRFRQSRLVPNDDSLYLESQKLPRSTGHLRFGRDQLAILFFRLRVAGEDEGGRHVAPLDFRPDAGKISTQQWAKVEPAQPSLHELQAVDILVLSEY